MKVELGGTQVDAAKTLIPGSLCSIQNLRLKIHADGLFRGHLGGPQKLIRKISQNESTPEGLTDALEALARCVH